MRVRGKIAILITVAAVLAILTLVLLRAFKPRQVVLQGVVIKGNADPNKQQPIEGADVIVTSGTASYTGKSDAKGYFRIALARGFRARQELTLMFRHSGYEPLQFSEPAGVRLYIARMMPLAPHAPPAKEHRPETLVADLSVRYSIKTTTTAEVGSAAKTFQVVNVGNVACDPKSLCSPDGKWNAVIGSGSLDAGKGNEFRSVRVSCIAGPCPFTRIEPDRISQGGRVADVSVLNWSDTATFLMEAEVFRRWVADAVRNSYPIVFGRALNFSLPADAQGPSIEAEVGGERIVFPLGPSLCLSWADCTVEAARDARTYRCELKPGYRF